MGYEEDAMCFTCKRKKNCEYPCEQYTDYILNKALIKVNTIVNKKENESMCDLNIEDVIAVSIDSAEFLQCVNGLRGISTILDEQSVLSVMRDINEEYCNKNNLCEICRCELEDYDDSSEHFGTPVTDRLSGCPRCGG